MHEILIDVKEVSGKAVPAVTSLQVAEVFEKQHKNVLQDIDRILSQVPEIFGRLNFEPSGYELKNNLGFPVGYPMYILTRDAFTLLTMGYTGEKAMRFKIAYIERFNEMERQLREMTERREKEEDAFSRWVGRTLDDLSTIFKYAGLQGNQTSAGALRTDLTTHPRRAMTPIFEIFPIISPCRGLDVSPMNGLNQNNGGDVPEYIDIAKGLWPLFLAGFAVAIATGATHVKKGYLQRNKLSIALNIILSSAVSSAISLGFALLAPLFYPGITADMKLGIVLVINGIGLKLFDVYMRKKHGLQVVDLSDTADIHELRKSMTPEQRRLHAQDCPFKGSECCGGTNQSCTFQSGGLRTVTTEGKKI